MCIRICRPCTQTHVHDRTLVGICLCWHVSRMIQAFACLPYSGARAIDWGAQLIEKFHQRFQEKLAHYQANQQLLNRRAFDSIDVDRTGRLQEQQVRKQICSHQPRTMVHAKKKPSVPHLTNGRCTGKGIS